MSPHYRSSTISLPSTQPGAEAVLKGIQRARTAQTGWAQLPVKRRLQSLRTLRQLLASEAHELALAAGEIRGCSVAEALTSEVLPLADAIRWLEKNAARILAPQRQRGSVPLWLKGVSLEIRREPLGLVLVVGPSNYPLFLPAVQMLQALAAGNAVLLKPAAGAAEPIYLLHRLLGQCAMDFELVQVLPEDPVAVDMAIVAGIHKLLLTGSAVTGETILRKLDGHLIPATLELSGCDAVFVRPDADMDLLTRALAFGLRLNRGRTCIAPRRVFVPQQKASELEGRLAALLQREPAIPVDSAQAASLVPLVLEALQQGGHLLAGYCEAHSAPRGPLVVAGARPDMRLLQADVFAPVLSLVTVSSEAEALRSAAQCSYALGASVWSRDLSAARKLASQISAGVVVINDLIVPTADPRVPFGGRGSSGYGVTRGAEGLLELTAPKAISVRRGSWRPHYEPARPGDEWLFTQYLQAVHGAGFRSRWHAAGNLVRALFHKTGPEPQ